jgi:hypothetical protein
MKTLSFLFLSALIGCGQNPDATLALHPPAENNYQEQGYNQDRDFDLIPDYEEIGTRTNPNIADLPITFQDSETLEINGSEETIVQNPFLRQAILKQFTSCKYSHSCTNNISLQDFLYYKPLSQGSGIQNFKKIDFASFNIRGLNAKNIIYNLEHNTARFIISTPTINKIYYLAHNQNTLSLINEILVKNNFDITDGEIKNSLFRDGEFSEQTIKNETIYFIQSNKQELFKIRNEHGFKLSDEVAININHASFVKFELNGVSNRDVLKEVRYTNISGYRNVLDQSKTTCSYSYNELSSESQIWTLSEDMLILLKIKQNDKTYTFKELNELGLIDYTTEDSISKVKIKFPENFKTNEEIFLVNESKHQVDSVMIYPDFKLAYNLDCSNGPLFNIYTSSPLPMTERPLFEEYKLTLKF